MRKILRVIKSEIANWQGDTNKSSIRKKQKRALSKRARKAMSSEGKDGNKTD